MYKQTLQGYMHKIHKSLFNKSLLVSKIIYDTSVGHVLFRHINQPTNLKYFPLNLWYTCSSCSLRYGCIITILLHSTVHVCLSIGTSIFAAFSPSKVKQSNPRMITTDGLQHIQRRDQNDSWVGVFRAYPSLSKWWSSVLHPY